MSRYRSEARKVDRHVRIYHWVLDTPAWKSLPANAKVVYIGLVRRYNGSNNGKVGYSERQAAQDANVSEATAWRSLRLLQDRGFIVPTVKGAFSRKIRHATEWRLTEFVCDVSPALATKDFASWQPRGNSEHAFTYEPVDQDTPLLRIHQ